MFRISFSSPLLGGYDEPEILRYAITSKWPKGADAGQYLFHMPRSVVARMEGAMGCIEPVRELALGILHATVVGDSGGVI